MKTGKTEKQENLSSHLTNARRSRNAWLALGVILLFGFVTKCYRLSYPSEFYFDEVYHASTATHYLAGDRQAYDPYAKPAEGGDYEWTHPPLAKLLMTASMAVTGKNSFGWRIGSVLFGTGAVALTALFALELFGSWPIALLSAFLLSIEGLAFVQSRIGMNDIYLICFALFAMLFYAKWKKHGLKKDLFLTGLGLGLSLATKWSAVYLFLIIAVDLLREIFWVGLRRRLSLGSLVLALGVVPAAVYLGSYLHFFLLGNDWQKFTALHDQMWYYHSQLKDTHTFGSKPWQWILDLRPVWMFTASSPPSGMTANIYNLGNVIILWSGLVAVYFLWFKSKELITSWARWFVLLCYLMLWVPWIFSPRVMFFYHYAPAVPFLCIILARMLVPMYFGDGLPKSPPPSRGSRRLVLAVVIAAVLWFVVFYPNLTGIAVPQGFADRVYFSIPGWRY